jgi:hypothetical protein
MGNKAIDKFKQELISAAAAIERAVEIEGAVWETYISDDARYMVLQGALPNGRMISFSYTATLCPEENAFE